MKVKILGNVLKIAIRVYWDNQEKEKTWIKSLIFRYLSILNYKILHWNTLNHWCLIFIVIRLNGSSFRKGRLFGLGGLGRYHLPLHNYVTECKELLDKELQIRLNDDSTLSTDYIILEADSSSSDFCSGNWIVIVKV